MKITVTVLLLCVLLAGCYREDDGVLTEGTLIEYKYINVYEDFRNMILHNVKSITANIDGNQARVSSLKISYIDKNNKFGSCIHYKEYNTPPLKVNSHIKCNDDLKVYFN